MHETYAAASGYLFGLSPPGNGVDCFRNYEFWALGVILFTMLCGSPPAMYTRSAHTIASEQRWLPALAERLGVLPNLQTSARDLIVNLIVNILKPNPGEITSGSIDADWSSGAT